MTGDPNRKAYFGIDHTKNPPSIRSFAFDAFTFPACKACNEGFSEFESSAKAIVEKILSASALTCGEVGKLLDWLDKVRQGLWLAFFTLNKNHAGLKRNHHIRGRIVPPQLEMERARLR